MDADAALYEMRMLVGKMLWTDDSADEKDAAGYRLAELVDALDDYIMIEGILPTDWAYYAADSGVQS